MARVLVADSDEDIRLIIKRVLTRAGFEVLTACDGMEALRAALAARVDVVLSAVNMPRMDGFQLCAALRADVEGADVPIALLSGSLLPTGRAAGSIRACRAWLKPMNNDDLAAGVGALVNFGRHEHPATSSGCRPVFGTTLTTPAAIVSHS